MNHIGRGEASWRTIPGGVLSWPPGLLPISSPGDVLGTDVVERLSLDLFGNTFGVLGLFVQAVAMATQTWVRRS